MDKRLVLLGIIALVIGIIFSYASGQQFLSTLSTPNNTQSGSIVLPGNSLAYINFTANRTSFFSIAYNSTNSLSFYLANASAFQALKPYYNSTYNLSERAFGLEGYGVFAIIANSPVGVIPFSSGYSGLFPVPTYSALGNSTFLPAGSYSLMFKSASPENTTMFYSFYLDPAANVDISNSGFFGFGIISGLLLIVGVALIVFGMISRREKSEAAKASDEEIRRMYESMDRKPARRRNRKAR